MAGLYIHIPFCATKCIYCDFYSRTDLHLTPAYIDALTRELELRRSYLGDESIATVYFGGGTPSTLQAADFDTVFTAIHRHYEVRADAEITLEANPDDISADYLRSLSHLPFNRISLGVQSFDDGELRMLRRRHTAMQALQAIDCCRDARFTNISIDLMYGLPSQTLESWERSLAQAIATGVEHISAYHLTYERGTELYRQKHDGIVVSASETMSESQFRKLRTMLAEAGYEHYEISNFCRDGFHSRHNSSYWDGTPYLGIGAAAHSYDGSSRQWNVASTEKYIAAIRSGKPDFERETLSVKDSYNEYIITRLRTAKGVAADEIGEKFSAEYAEYFSAAVKRLIDNGLLVEQAQRIRLSPSGLFISDSIFREIMR